MILPVPQCWAYLCLNHLSALPFSPYNFCTNQLPAKPCKSRVCSPGEGEDPQVETSQTPMGRLRQSRKLSTEQPPESWQGMRKSELSARGQEAQVSKVPAFNLSQLPGIAAVPAASLSLSPRWVRFQWQCSNSSMPCPSGQAVTQALGWQGLAACFASGVLQSHRRGLFEELWVVVASKTNTFWV